jgi:signal transduction histidine kinase
MPDEETQRRIGLGLQSIEERVRILGGTHAIESAPGQGTTVTLRIALKDKQR